MKRPTGITIIALLLFVSAAINTFRILSFFSSQSGNPVLLFSLLNVIGSLGVGLALWFLNQYGRWLALLAAARGLLRYAGWLLLAPSALKHQHAPRAVFYLILLGTIILYLLRPDVRRAFEPFDRYTADYDPAEDKQNSQYTNQR